MVRFRNGALQLDSIIRKKFAWAMSAPVGPNGCARDRDSSASAAPARPCQKPRDASGSPESPGPVVTKRTEHRTGSHW